MKRPIVFCVVLGACTLTCAACSLLVATDGLSGGAGDAGSTPAVEGGGPMTDASSDSCAGDACAASPLPACDGACVPLEIAGGTGPAGIAADETGVYWTSQSPGGDIMRASVDGKTVVTVFAGNRAPTKLALDATNVYWTENNSGLVSASRKDADHGPRAMLGGFTLIWGIAVSGNEVFIHVRSTGEVRRLPLDLTTSALLTTQAGGQVLRLAADNASVYLGVGSGGFQVVQRATRAMQTTVPITITTPVSDLEDFAMDGARVYYGDADKGLVFSENVDGSGGAMTHASGEGAPVCFAVDGTDVYWGDRDRGLIRRVAKSGGTPQTLASGQAQPIAIAVNSQAVYWINGGTGTVMTVRKP